MGGDGHDSMKLFVHGSDHNVTQSGDEGNDRIDISVGSSKSTIIQDGGEGNDLFDTLFGGSENSFIQNGGAGNDTFKTRVHEPEAGTLIQDGGAGDDFFALEVFTVGKGLSTTLSGGTGTDTFKISHDLDDVQIALDDTSTSPYLLASITDFDTTAAEHRETLDIRGIYYSKIPALDATGKVFGWFTNANFVGAVKTGNKVENLDDALNGAAKDITKGKIGVFDFDGNTYVFGNNIHDAVDKGDLLIKLEGIAANTVLAASFLFYE